MRPIALFKNRAGGIHGQLLVVGVGGGEPTARIYVSIKLGKKCHSHLLPVYLFMQISACLPCTPFARSSSIVGHTGVCVEGCGVWGGGVIPFIHKVQMGAGKPIKTRGSRFTVNQPRPKGAEKAHYLQLLI